MHSLECKSGGLFSVDVGSGLVFQPALPESGQGLALAQEVGTQLQEGFAGVVLTSADRQRNG